LYKDGTAIVSSSMGLAEFLLMPFSLVENDERFILSPVTFIWMERNNG